MGDDDTADPSDTEIIGDANADEDRRPQEDKVKAVWRLLTEYSDRFANHDDYESYVDGGTGRASARLPRMRFQLLERPGCAVHPGAS